MWSQKEARYIICEWLVYIRAHFFLWTSVRPSEWSPQAGITPLLPVYSSFFHSVYYLVIVGIWHVHSSCCGQLPIHIKLTGSQEKVLNDTITQKKKGKLIEGKSCSTDSMDDQEADPKKCLDTLDIFSGCGGLSEGLQKSGITSFQLHAMFSLF